MLPVVSHPDYDAGFPATHRFPMGKYSALMRVLERRGLLVNLHRPALAPASWLARAHDRAYVDQVIGCVVPKTIEREIGFPITERVSLRAQLASAGTILAARLALEHGVACNTAGGSHHARHAQGAGFCTLNDVAIAALTLLEEGLASNIGVIDLDVHQGDGTAEILGREDRVFTVSMHGERNYPVRKVASSLDVALPDGTSDDAYLTRLDALLTQVSAAREFDIVFFNAGVDTHREDRLGRLALSDNGLRMREYMVIAHYRRRGVPICGVLGGGYSMDVEALAERHAILFEVASEFA